MLDQNTDRMWYVIGAVIVGAALIFLMNGTFPELFASIGGSFQDKVAETTEMTDGIRPITRDKSLLTHEDMHIDSAELIDYDAKSYTWVLDVRPSSSQGYAAANANGMRIKGDRFEVPYGETLTLSYEIWIPEGLTGIVANNDINNHPFKRYYGGWSGNDNDLIADRTHNGVKGLSVRAVPLTGGKWNTVSFTYTNSSPANTERVSIYDNSRFGVTNPFEEHMRVTIRNVRITVTGEKG